MILRYGVCSYSACMYSIREAFLKYGIQHASTKAHDEFQPHVCTVLHTILAKSEPILPKTAIHPAPEAANQAARRPILPMQTSTITRGIRNNNTESVQYHIMIPLQATRIPSFASHQHYSATTTPDTTPHTTPQTTQHHTRHRVIRLQPDALGHA